MHPEPLAARYRNGHAVAARAVRVALPHWLTAFALLLMAALVLVSGQAAAQGSGTPLAGSTISNTASATYRNETLGIVETVTSNTTVATVAPVEGVSLVPDLTVFVPPGGTATFPHVLTNTGNVSETITLTFQPQGGDDYDLNGLRLFLDENGNGVVDPGERELFSGDTLVLTPGQVVNLVLTGTVPAVVLPDTRAVQILVATTAGGVTDSVTDIAITRNGGELQLTKAIDNPLARAGDTITYTLSALNVGNTPVPPTTVTVDGALRDLVVIRDTIPVNTRFVSVVQTSGGIALYHTVGQALQVYSTTPPGDLGQVDAIAFGYGTVQPSGRVEPSFRVLINAIAGGRITNVAEAYAEDDTGTETRVVSNPVILDLPVADGSIDYYNNGNFNNVIGATSAGSPLYLQAFAAVCNVDPTVAESYPLRLTTANANDLETGFIIRETTPNSGIFTLIDVPTAPWPLNAQVTNDAIVQAGLSDTVTATLVCGSATLSTQILIDPSGVVYDSQTNQPVAGATVQLFVVNPDGSLTPATVLDINGNPAPNTVVTGPDGVFSFPSLPPGNYRLVVTPPTGYTFPSQFPPAQQPIGRRINDGSYGRDFSVNAANGAVVLDVPLDPGAAPGALALEKAASVTSIGIGETLRYTLRLRNDAAFALTNTRVTDTLPRGFRYVANSVRYNRAVAAEPAGAPGPNLVFTVGSVAPGAVFEITYLVTAGVGSSGNAVNSATAISDQSTSNTATATVTIENDVFRDEAYILGKVYTDCNHSRLQDGEELGIPGVRLYLDDGTFVITDAEGKFSFYGVSPRTHVIKIDPITLPPGSELINLANRNAGDPHSRFVDVKRGELHRADFAEGSCTVDIIKDVKVRREKGEVFGAEINKRLDNPLNLETLRIDPRTQPSSGVIDRDGRVSAYSPLLFDRPVSQLDGIPPLNGSARSAPSLNLETQLPKETSNEFGFMDLNDGDTVATRDLSVRLIGRAGAEFTLSVNGEEVPKARVGQKAVLASRDLQAWEYIAVRLQPGANRLAATAVDSFGNSRGTAEITLIAPGDLGKLELIPPPSGAVADGQTPAHVIVRLVDDKGVKVTARTPVTLETSIGRWDVVDLDPKEPGTQIFVEGGEALVDLVPLSEPGEARLRATSGRLKHDVKLPFLPYLRPLIASGVLEGAFNFSKLKTDNLQPVTAEDGFEEDIEEINFGGGRSQGGVRGSAFLKGKVKGDLLLTLAYDSDKDTRDRLFRDIDPESFYPVYGDSGIKGFDAQSTSKLYVRVDKGRSYLLYGDFNTNGNYLTGGNGYNASGAGDGSVLERRLANYNRSLTGARYHYENDRAAISLFASYDRRRQQVSEIRGQGISGPYPLNVQGFVRNSEKIEVITRDRNQPSFVIDTLALTRFTDYSINEIDGSILFGRPVPSVDANLNPIFIRVTFELDTGGERFWVYGAEGQYKLTDFLEVGASVARDDDPTNRYRLYGLNANVKLGAGTFLALEGARSESDLGGKGNAARGELIHRGTRTEARVFYGQTDNDFENANAAINSGRREAGFKGVLKLTDRLRVGTEGIYSNDSSAVISARKGVLGYVQYALTPQLTLETGLRRAVGEESGTLNGAPTTREINTTSARAKLTYTPSFLAKASVFGEYEQDLNDKDLRLAAVGGDYQIGARARLYARHEFLTGLNGVYNLTDNTRDQNNTVFGIDWGYIDTGAVFSEYRVRDAISGREAEAALGLRNTWNPIKDVKLYTTFERIQPVNDEGRKTTAASIGGEYLIDPLTKAAARVEYRTSDTEDSILNTLALARKINLDWTVLGRNTISWSDREGTGLLVRDRIRLGFAYRDTDSNHFIWLGRYEARYDRDEAAESRRLVHILSTNINYQPYKSWIFAGRWASKLVDERFTELDADSNTHLLSGRVTVDVTEKIDFGILASNLFSGGFQSNQYGIGAEAGYLLTSNLWLSGGYNFLGFQDDDLEDADYTRQGPYIRLRFKFDEDLFKFLE
ncbi:SpaA isopeptide-forming pilin-related protein [Nevskia sp.]|uniref:SpaA isopeptide-forming pilin-related protein n=1 Tax=Nevskia sp. TaxID=1929292 RepID=UPI0025EC66F9|nr:SpaA isopeptide-forming pilin-related protein [Nevskia sp.]